MGVENKRTEYRIALFVLVIVLIINPSCDAAAFDLVKGNNASITNIHCDGAAGEEECLNIWGDTEYLELLLMDSQNSHRGRSLGKSPIGTGSLTSYTTSATQTVPNCPQGTPATACLEQRTCTGIFNCYPSQ